MAHPKKDSIPEPSYHFAPRRTIFGVGCVSTVPAEVRRLGGSQVLVVTDPGVVKAGVASRVVETLESDGIPTSVFDGVQANPTVGNILAGAAAICDVESTVVVGVGGGSPLDAAKMIGAVAVNGGPVQQYDGIDNIPRRMLPMVAVNTTAGTGSDVTRWAVITDSERQLKMAIGSENIMPDVAVDDPLLTVGMPPAVTAGTGMDAFTHALEGHVGRLRTPLTDGLAVSAIALISRYLKRAYDDGEDIEAREKMLYAQVAAGLSFQNAGVGNVHAMAHQLGAIFDMPHGLSNAVLLPYVMEYNLPACEREFAAVACAMGLDTAGMSTQAAARASIEAVLRLNADVGIPRSLVDTPADAAYMDTLVAQALKDLGAGTNPRATSGEEMRDLWQRAFDGVLESE
jgi:alcohol dehydrogenase